MLLIPAIRKCWNYVPDRATHLSLILFQIRELSYLFPLSYLCRIITPKLLHHHRFCLNHTRQAVQSLSHPSHLYPSIRITNLSPHLLSSDGSWSSWSKSVTLVLFLLYYFDFVINTQPNRRSQTTQKPRPEKVTVKSTTSQNWNRCIANRMIFNQWLVT